MATQDPLPHWAEDLFCFIILTFSVVLVQFGSKAKEVYLWIVWL